MGRQIEKLLLKALSDGHVSIGQLCHKLASDEKTLLKIIRKLELINKVITFLERKTLYVTLPKTTRPLTTEEKKLIEECIPFAYNMYPYVKDRDIIKEAVHVSIIPLVKCLDLKSLKKPSHYVLFLLKKSIATKIFKKIKKEQLPQLRKYVNQYKYIDDKDEIVFLFRKISEYEQKLLIQRYYYDYTVREIAQKEKYTKTTIQLKITQALNKLKC